MAYTPKTWVCGETITAEALNNIEEGIQDALDCCESGGDPGYSCTETSTTLTEESVTTSGTAPYIMGNFSYSSLIDADTLTVTFNGTEYEADKIDFGDAYAYGGFTPSGPDFSEYPFAIMSQPTYGNFLYTEIAGTYSVKIVATTSTVETSGCFEKAVKKVTSSSRLKYVKDYVADNGGVVENNVTQNNAGQLAHAEGDQTTASGDASHAEGYLTNASGKYSHAEGNGSVASGDYAHAEITATASGKYSHAEGYAGKAIGENSHAEGDRATASGTASHAEGHVTKAESERSHAEGDQSVASGSASHAEGFKTTASGDYSHTEGGQTTASGDASHAEGGMTTASGDASHAEGNQTIANHRSQHVFGEWNVEDPSTAAATAKGNYVEIVGNGTGNSARSNARTLDWNGNEVLKGSLTLGNTTLTEAQLIQLLALI